MVQVYVSGKLPMYPSPKPTLTLTSHLGQNVGLGEEVGSFPETYPSPKPTWIIIRFWETAHLPLPQTNINTHVLGEG